MKNSKGSVYYGMHFYPGLAEYQDKDKGAYRVFLNEDTIRSMGPSFVGRPVFVSHVDDVEKDLDKLRNEADGWVIESFFNEADGKHWVKFIVCSDRGEQAIKRGFRLSNCYLPTSFSKGGIWNGISYQKEITGGEYDHLAIVPNPRYEESVIMTPEQFKKYNESKRVVLDRVTNNNDDHQEDTMKFKFFKREKIENALDVEATCVVLTKSNREVTIAELCNEADEAALAKDKPRLCNDADFVMIDDEQVLVSDLVKAFNAKDEPKEEVCNEDDDEDEVMENEEDDKKEEKEEKVEEKKENKKKKNEAHPDAVKLRNAKPKLENEAEGTYNIMGGANLGKQRYGSK